MCVIMASTIGKRIPEDWLKAGYDANSHGAGLAWRGHKNVIHWKKGLDLEEFLEEYRKIPEGTKHVAHFRIASCGGVLKELTHPFPLGDESSLALEGTTKGGVLFHNGHLHSWKSKLEEMAARSGGTIKIPVGPWSDTRAMAYITHKLGLGMLGFFDEKLVYLSPDRFDIYSSDVNKWVLRDQIHCSNTGWDHRVKRYQGHSSNSSSSSSSSSASSEKEDHPRASSCVGLPNTKTDVKGSQGVNPPLGPFLQDPSLWPVPPRSIRTKGQRKRWRKRMERKGLLPTGPERHRIRQRTKYLEWQREQAEKLTQMRASG